MALEGVVSLDGAGSKVSAGGEVRREGGRDGGCGPVWWILF